MSEEKSLPQHIRGAHIHFVGIKGTGCIALVEILYARGAVITGSDVSERFYTDEILDKLGLKALPFSEENITSDIACVIYSSAYNPEKNPDLIAARRLGIPMLLYTEALGAVSRLSCCAGICGVHGKTTTTGLTGTILKALDLPSQVLAGSIIASFDGNGLSGSCTMTSPTFEKASKQRIDGKMQCHYRLAFDEDGHSMFYVFNTCKHFIRCIPSLVYSETNVEDVDTDQEDHNYDEWRYMCMSRPIEPRI
ncbi:MAG: hypothetical protein II684_03680, partial [Treponema sp.]|nr:hypothetical protein [Treponema sp.]